MSSINILVIDDSTDFTSGFERLIQSLGHTATITVDPEEGKRLLTQEEFDLILVDCFMPTTDGFTLAAELSTIIVEQELSSKIILMSGILIDDASKKEAHSHSYIEDYLIKPISKETLDETLARYSNTSEASVLLEFLQPALTDTEALECLSSTTKINGFELAYILPAMSDFEFSHTIKLTDNKTQSTYSVGLNSGFLTNISSSEYNNSLGELLVGLGYLTREDLSSYINSDEFKTSKKPIGKALVELNLLSPHAVPVALKQQNVNRLADILALENLSCVFEHEHPAEKDHSCSLNLYDIKRECKHWVQTHPSVKFINVLESVFNDFSFQKTSALLEEDPHYAALSKILSSPINKYSDAELCLIYESMIEGKLCLSGGTDTSFSLEQKSIMELVKSLKFKNKQNNPYSLFNLEIETATDQQVSKAYQSFAKELHPDKLSSVLSPSELKEAQNIFTEITKAFNLIKTSDNRKTFESFKKNKGTQTKLQCNNNLEAAKTLLNKGEYTKAVQILDQPEMHSNYPNEFGLYYLWASLKSKTPSKVKGAINSILEKEKKSLTNSSLYYYIKSLVSLQESDNEGFKKFIALSLNADAQFLPARREVQMMKRSIATKPKAKSWFSFKKTS